MKIKFLSIFLLFFTACNLTASNETEQYIKVNTSTLYSLEENKNIDLDENFLIINYWASWCLECIEEHELLLSLAELEKFNNSVVMVSFQDNVNSSIDFLNNYGYGNIIYAVDNNSKLAIDSGVFGVPETHLVKDGIIIKKFIGPLNLVNIEEIINNFP